MSQDVDGPYEVDPNWPKPISALPGHEKWTYGAVESVFAESPNRVFILERGEIPNLKRPEEVAYPSVGPSISFPVSQVPWRNASVGPVTSAGNPVWSGKLGVDARWEHCIVVVDANGNIIEDWTKWDKMLRRPHSITMNPYDPEKHVWVVDDQGHAVYEFTHDGKELVKTLGTPPPVWQTTGEHSTSICPTGSSPRTGCRTVTRAVRHRRLWQPRCRGGSSRQAIGNYRS